MKLFNTLTQRVETFVPLEGNNVRIYVCGVTPYDTTHLGHAFTYASFDTLIRYLEFRGYSVRYVQNVTDIDDDILRKARELGVPWDELGRRETERFLRDMDALNVRRPTFYVRATDEIPHIIEMVQKLVERGYAYVSDGCVYYDVRHDPDFGALGRAIGLQDYAAMLAVANERGNYPDDRRKRDPLDFVLWQAQAPGEPAWPSPWGPGRPGWHIECSAMSLHYLGDQLDIHGGGADLAFPHHTCEIAQSEHYTGKTPFVRYWLHTAMVYQQGEKMSKSLGNLTLVSDLLKQYSANAIRLLLLNHHYRQPWECFPADLQLASQQATLFEEVAALAARCPTTATTESSELRARFESLLDDDLKTPEALQLLQETGQAALASHDACRASDVVRLLRVLGLRC
ncbi:cysteine--tRNA ligase [Thermogemmatispora carboxidivorans]|uniref:cysteine--tRNA ligase n=1 Tax=Thermogemmatispora carboxidivorans TaxID=1382306 RepID=UPI00069B5C84|nr:cysteine--tRNA ligase [Thermogemmatispora carboxidivorans]